MTTEPAAAIPGFEHVHRYWDATHERWMAKILPGEMFVTQLDESMTTVLGSCVAACVRDPLLRVGGMNHFMLPTDESSGRAGRSGGWDGAAARYGSYAMESLINELLKLGAKRERLQVKVFGGGKILSSMTGVGAQNIAFVKQFLRLQGLTVLAEDMGDIFPRRVIFFPHTGLALVKRLPALEGTAIAQREARYSAQLSHKGVDDDAELFA